MVLGLEIGLLVVGLIVLITGKFKLGKHRAATGAAARFAGLWFLLPIPLAFGILMIPNLARAGQGKELNSTDWKLTSTLIELGVCVVCALLGSAVALAMSSPSEPSPRRKEKIAKRKSPAPATPAEEP